MSRAFTKEDDAGDDRPERPVPPGPNYVTARGLELLYAAVRDLAEKKEAADADEKARIDRDLRYLEARIDTATVVPPGAGPEIRFGATVTLKNAAGDRETFQIVGTDEARTGDRFLAWSAPRAMALMGAQAGDTVSWDGPDGEARATVVAVRYEKPPA